MGAEIRQSARNRLIVISSVMAMAFALIVALAWNASSRTPQSMRRLAQAVAVRTADGFKCDWTAQTRPREYACTGAEGPFRLTTHLLPGEPLGGSQGGWDGLAIPDTFSCQLRAPAGPAEPAPPEPVPPDAAPADVIPAERFHCSYTHRGTAKDAQDRNVGVMHTHQFRLSEAVLVSLGNDPASDQETHWVLPHQEAAPETGSDPAPECRLGSAEPSTGPGQAQRAARQVSTRDGAADTIVAVGHKMVIPRVGC
jgi:hypothetical protein